MRQIETDITHVGAVIASQVTEHNQATGTFEMEEDGETVILTYADVPAEITPPQ